MDQEFFVAEKTGPALFAPGLFHVKQFWMSEKEGWCDSFQKSSRSLRKWNPYQFAFSISCGIMGIERDSWHPRQENGSLR
jgi:hypothetical protein